MDRKTLKEYRFLILERADLERRMEILKKQIKKMEDIGVVSDTVSGGDGGIQHFKITGFPTTKYSQKRTLLMSQLLRYEEDGKRIDELCKDVQKFVCSIPDARDRMVFRYYYFDGMRQEDISRKLGLERSAISKIIEKYLGKDKVSHNSQKSVVL